MKDFEQILDEAIKMVNQKAEKELKGLIVTSIRNVKGRFHWTTQETMDFMSTPPDKQARYVQMV